MLTLLSSVVEGAVLQLTGEGSYVQFASARATVTASCADAAKPAILYVRPTVFSPDDLVPGLNVTAEFKHEIKYAAEHAVMLKFFEFRSKRGYSPFKPDHKYFGGIAGAGPSSPAATQVAVDESDWSSTPSSVGSPAPKKVARGLF